MVPTVFIFAAVCFIKLPTINSSLIGYRCSENCCQPQTVPIKNLLPACETLAPWTKPQILATVTEIRGPKTIVGYRCDIQFNQTIVDYSGSKRPGPNGIVMVERETCFEVHKTRTIELHGNNITDINPEGTTIHTVTVVHQNQSGTISDLQYERTYIINLSTHNGTVDLDRDIVTFDSGMNCDFSNFGCADEKDKFVQMYWTTELNLGQNRTGFFLGVIKLFTLNSSLTRPAITYGLFPVIDEDKFIVMKLNPLNYLNSNETNITAAFWAENTDWFVDILPYLPYRELGYYNGNYAPMVFDMNKTGAVYMAIIRGKGNVGFNTLLHWCQNERAVLQDLLERHPVKTDMFEFRLKGKVGFKDGNDSFRVMMCPSTMVTNRETKECFHKMPVKDDSNTDYFLDPFSRVLTLHADSVPCNKTVPVSSALPDWPELIFYLLISSWGLTIFVRLAKLIVQKFWGGRAARYANINFDYDEGQTIILVTIFDLVRPPFVGKWPNIRYSEGYTRKLA